MSIIHQKCNVIISNVDQNRKSTMLVRELTDTTYFYLGGWGFWFYILKTDVIQTLFFFNINVQYLKNNYLEHYLLIFLVKKEVHYNLLLMN